MRDGRVRGGAPVRRGVRRAARQPGRVHARVAAGLLQRQPGGRVQPAGGGAAGERAGQLQRRGLRRRPAADLPAGAGRAGGRPDGGVPERVRRVRHGPVLLPRPVRGPRHVPAHRLL